MRNVRGDVIREERVDDTHAAVEDRGAAIKATPVDNRCLLREDPVRRIGAHEAAKVRSRANEGRGM